MATSTGRRSAALDTWTRSCIARRRRAAARLFSGILTLILGVSALAACAPSQPATKAATATPQATATPAPRLVYQADWSHGLAGWKATPGWTLSDGILHSDMGSGRELTSPFQPPAPNYVVEFRVQLITAATTGGTQYEMSADPAANSDGYIMLVEHVSFSHTRLFPDHPHEMIYIDPMLDQQDNGVHTLQIHDFEPGTLWRTYRVEVHGPVATLLIDGHVASWARGIKTPQLSTGALHFFSTGIELRLTGFKVYVL